MEPERRFPELAQIIPGYAGYRAQEDRREADKQLRMYLAQQYTVERDRLVMLAQQLVAAGRLDQVEQLDQIERALGLFISRLGSAPRGYAGWFTAPRISTDTLDKIYAFDAKLADAIPLLREHLDFTVNAFAADASFAEALTALRDFIHNLNSQFDARQAFLAAGQGN